MDVAAALVALALDAAYSGPADPAAEVLLGGLCSVLAEDLAVAVGVPVGLELGLPSMTGAAMAAPVSMVRIDTAPAVGLDEDGLLCGAGVEQRSPAYLKGEGIALTDATVYWP